jgi:hypothetical protein
VASPEADALAAELARLDASEEEYEDVGPLRFAQGTSGSEPSRSTRKMLLGVGALVIIALVGLVFGIRAITNSGQPNPAQTTQSNTNPQAGGNTGEDNEQPAESPTPTKFALSADDVRIVDPPPGTRDDSGEARFTIDDNKETAWETQGYNRAKFGDLKRGMGVLINLGSAKTVSEVRVETSAPGVSMDLRTGTSDPGDNSAGDDKIVDSYTRLTDGDVERTDGTTEILPVPTDVKHQYILLWLSELPRADDGKYRVSVNSIEVYGY